MMILSMSVLVGKNSSTTAAKGASLWYTRILVLYNSRALYLHHTVAVEAPKAAEEKWRNNRDLEHGQLNRRLSTERWNRSVEWHNIYSPIEPLGDYLCSCTSRESEPGIHRYNVGLLIRRTKNPKSVLD